MRLAPRERFFYGWVVVSASIVAAAITMGLMFSLGVFMEPLELTFGWGRGDIARASLFGWIAFGLSSFGFGALSDRLGTRYVVMIGGTIFGAGMLALSRMQSLWHLYLIYGLLIGGGNGAFLVPLTSTVMRWFNHRRAVVVALTNAGIGIGSTLIAPLTRYLVSLYDWRMTCVIFAALAWGIILPVASLILNRPQDIGLQPYGGEARTASHPAAAVDTAFGQVLRSPAFWVIAFVHFFCCAAHSGPLFHMVSRVIDAGVPKLAAATVFSWASLASIVGRIGTGVLAERWGSKPVLIAWLFMQASAVLLYVLPRDYGSFTALAVYFGFSYGGVMPLYAVVTRELFGARAMGASYGGIFFISCIGMGIGAWIGGQLFDYTGTYQLMYVLSFLYGSAGAILVLWLRAPGPQWPAPVQAQPAAT
jgi:MFS family permease